MAEALDIRELLDAPLSNFPDLPNLPGGKWFHATIIGMEAGRSTVKGTPFFRFPCRITEPGKDVTEAEMQKVKDAGVSLADYNAGADFYLTKDAMRMFRRFLTSTGVPENVSVREALKLGTDINNPITPETIELVKGTPVMVKTPLPDGQGRVFTRNIEMIGTANQT